MLPEVAAKIEKFNQDLDMYDEELKKTEKVLIKMKQQSKPSK